MSDVISRQAALDALHMHLMYRMGTDSNKKRLDEWINNLPSAQPEYTENEEKVLVMMFAIVKNILDLQDGYMNIDNMSFGHNELFNLSEKLGIDY